MQQCFMSFIHKYVSPVRQGTHKVSEKKTLSLFLRTHISKNWGTMELIQIFCRYDVISEMWADFTPIRNITIRNNALRVLEVIWSLFTLANTLTLRANLYWREYV